MTMKKSLLLLSAALCSCLAWADPQAINLAGQQRMLSQRIVKAYAQIGTQVLPGDARVQLDQGLTQFEANLEALDQVPEKEASRRALADLKATWKPLKAAAMAPVSLEGARQLDMRAEAVLLAAERLTQALQDESAEPARRWTNLAGRQRMLSQRLVKAYMLRQWGLESSALEEQMDNAMAGFSAAQESLSRQSDNSTELRQLLEEIALQWEWLRTALATEGAASFRFIVAASSEAILELTDQATRQAPGQSPP